MIAWAVFYGKSKTISEELFAYGHGGLVGLASALAICPTRKEAMKLKDRWVNSEDLTVARVVVNREKDAKN